MAITRYADVTWAGDLVSGDGTINYVSSGAFSPPAGHLGVPHRRPQRPHEPRGARSRPPMPRASRWPSPRGLAKNGTPAAKLDVKAVVTFDKADAGWKIARSES